MNRRNTNDIVQLYDLVRTEDGYYGIVTDYRKVFLGNGGETTLSDYEWTQLVVMPLNIFNTEGASSNFRELYEGRSFTQCRQRQEADAMAAELGAADE